VDCKVGGESRHHTLFDIRQKKWKGGRRLKLVDPAWADPIKQLVKTRAKEQQARAVAQVVEATARSRMLGKGNFP
jgi:hypothetical protein